MVRYIAMPSGEVCPSANIESEPVAGAPAPSQQHATTERIGHRFFLATMPPVNYRPMAPAEEPEVRGETHAVQILATPSGSHRRHLRADRVGFRRGNCGR